MKQKRLFLTSGIAGSGKSTWVKNRVAKSGGVWISRDAVRFSLLQPGDEYFSREDEVFDTYLQRIQEAIDNEDISDIYADATHLNKKARNKVIYNLNLKNIDELNCVYFDISADVAIQRNSNRTGQENVPDTVIRNMAAAHYPPLTTEKFNKVIYVHEDNTEEEVQHLCLLS
jgi:predicted kinase